jgi:hypothetical protein
MIRTADFCRRDHVLRAMPEMVEIRHSEGRDELNISHFHKLNRSRLLLCTS